MRVFLDDCDHTKIQRLSCLNTAFCDPLIKDPIKMGEIEKGKIMDIGDRFRWADLLDKMNGANERDIHFFPSVEFENRLTRHGLAISFVEEEKGNEFYIFL